MNLNVWNIKEILSIPNGSSGAKTINRNATASGYCSLPDSQFLFGSQLWPENSQAMSQEMSFSSRTSQQSSQEGSEPKFLINYHTKPFLFGGEGKDKMGVQKPLGMLDRFEEDRKKAKEKSESDTLTKEIIHLKEMLNNIQQRSIGTEENTAVCKTILEGFNNFETTLQKNLASIQTGISEQFETMLTRVSTQKQMLTEMEEKIHKTGVATAELGSHVYNIKNSLEAVIEEQGREQNMLNKALNLLSTLVSKYSTKSGPITMSDRAIQTSPGLQKQFSIIQQDNKLRCRQPTPRKPKYSEAEVPSQKSCFTRKHKSTLVGQRRCRKRPLLLSQRSTGTICDENCQPVSHNIQQKIVSTPLKQLHDLDRGAKVHTSTGAFFSPLSCWSQDSNSPMCTTKVKPSSQKLSAETDNQGNVKGLWHWFDINSDSDS